MAIIKNPITRDAQKNCGWEVLTMTSGDVDYAEAHLTPAQVEEIDTFNNLMAALLSAHVTINDVPGKAYRLSWLCCKV